MTKGNSVMPLASGFIPDGRAAWRRLTIAFAIGTLGNASSWTAVTLIPVLQLKFDLSRTATSYPYIAIMVGFLAASPVFGKLSDRYGVAPILATSCILMALGYAWSGFAPNFALYLIGQFVVGLGTAAGFGPLTADLSHWFIRRRGFALGVSGCSIYVAGLIWSSVIPVLLPRMSWENLHLIFAGSLVLALPLTALLRKAVPVSVIRSADVKAASTIHDMGVSSQTVRLLLGFSGVACCVAMAIPQIHIVAFCMDLGFTLAQGSGLLGMMLGAGIVSRLVVGYIIDYAGGLRVLLASLLLQIMSLILFLNANGMVSLYAMSLVFGLAQGGILPAYPLIVRDLLPASRAGAAIGQIIMATIGGMILGSWLSGWIYDLTRSYGPALLNGIGISFLGLCAMAWLFFKSQKAMR